MKGPVFKISAMVLLVILAVILAALLSGCNKHLNLKYGAAVTGEVKLHAELDTTASKQVQTADSSYQEEEQHQRTQEATPGDSTGLMLTAADLKPAVDATGETVGRKYTARKGRTQVDVDIDKKGNARIDCKTDSLKREVDYLYKRSSYAEHRSDSMQSYIMNALLYREVKTDSSVVMQSREVKGGGFEWFWVSACVVCLMAGGYIGFKLG